MGPTGHRSERLIRRILAVILIVTCARVWLGEAVATPRSAHAQVFDPAAQRKAILEAIERSNVLLTEIRNHLKTGVVNVRSRSTDNQQDGAGSDAVDRP